MKRLTIAAAILLMTTPALGQAAERPKVSIESGALAGTGDGSVLVFKDIPYAAPPTGDLRWMPPAPPARWSSERDASKFGPVCPQPPRPDRVLAAGGNLPQSEDCLSLNVWAPKTAKNAPVMVWMHGGAHRFGSGESPIYDGTTFARDGIVLVTLNYRLGLLGYFAHPALTKAARTDAPLGNYGEMDKIAALKGVQANIAQFGGDAKNVTVFGESAGGASILYLLATPSVHGLFQKAVVESGGGWVGPVTLEKKEAEGSDFATRAGLPGAGATLAQLRALPVEKTFDIAAKLGFGPFVDGRLFTQTPTQAFASGRAIDVPLVIGTNSYEASLMHSFSIPASWIASQATPAVRTAYASDAASDDSLAEALFTDGVMGAPAHWVAARASEGAPSYLYHFSYVPTLRRGTVPGAGHGTEIPYVFASGTTFAARYGITLSDQDRAMEQLVHSCWVSFAKTGSPDCTGQHWPAYAPSSDQLLEFGPNTGIVSGFRKAQYEALKDRMPQSSVVAEKR